MSSLISDNLLRKQVIHWVTLKDANEANNAYNANNGH